MKFTQVAISLLFSGAAIAAPAVSRSTQICGQWDRLTTGPYTVYQDLWGKNSATSGSQCTTVGSLSGNTIALSTSWSWEGGHGQVKSYANVALDSVAKAGVQVSAISKIPAVWKWAYTGSEIVADVSWDLFTSSTPGGENEYEIMIWLAALGGAGPISSTGSPIGTATIGGQQYKVYSGPNGKTTVYSFVSTNEITNFNGDLKEFLTYLATNEKWSTSQYLNVLQAGTEPFSGSNAVFSVSAYSVSVSQGEAEKVVVSTPTSTSSTSSQEQTSTTKAAVAPTSTSKAPYTKTSVTSVSPTSTSKAPCTKTTKTAVATPTTPSSSTGAVPLYGNCTGGLTCAAGSTCIVQNPWYSQCVAA